MKNNNKNIRVNIPGIPCGIALMPMKDVYQKMYGDVVTAQNSLLRATSAKTIRHVLQKIYEYRIDNRVSEDIQHMVKNIQGGVPAMHMNDITRYDMVGWMDGLLTALRDAIEEEERKEIIDDCHRIFQFMTDHAEEFVDWFEKTHQKQ